MTRREGGVSKKEGTKLEYTRQNLRWALTQPAVMCTIIVSGIVEWNGWKMRGIFRHDQKAFEEFVNLLNV